MRDLIPPAAIHKEPLVQHLAFQKPKVVVHPIPRFVNRRNALLREHVLSRIGYSGKLIERLTTLLMDTQNFSVLLVEDDLNDIFLVKRAFKLARVKNPLQVVTDGQEAVSYLKGEGKYADREQFPLPKLMVMDIKMPRRSGFEVLEWIKGSPGPLKRIPVVIVSSSEDPSDINRAYELGANAYMVKPVDYRAVEHLFQAITQYWGLECAKPELEFA